LAISKKRPSAIFATGTKSFCGSYGSALKVYGLVTKAAAVAQKSVPVCLGTGDVLRRDDTPAARAVFDNDLLAQTASHLLDDKSAENVAYASSPRWC
jgi:hypothetical protein